MILRHPEHLGLSGYVAVPRGHPWHKLDRYEAFGVQVHGGLTYFALRCVGGGCHLGRCEEGLHWIGFDCGHFGDLIPRQTLRAKSIRETYRNISFVRRQCERVARQLRTAAPDFNPRVRMSWMPMQKGLTKAQLSKVHSHARAAIERAVGVGWLCPICDQVTYSDGGEILRKHFATAGCRSRAPDYYYKKVLAYVALWDHAWAQAITETRIRNHRMYVPEWIAKLIRDYDQLPDPKPLSKAEYLIGITSETPDAHLRRKP